MAEIKTKQHDGDVGEFIRAFADTPQKIEDSFALVKLMQDFTGFEPKMWGPSIIGFGVYHYKSDRSKQEGDWPLIGFSPRKAAISLYIYSGTPEEKILLGTLGKYTMGKACIYIKKLADIDTEVLKKIMALSMSHTRQKYG